jgi:hypothetical protein
MDDVPPEALLEGLLGACAPPIRELAESLRKIVRAAAPDATERVRGGWRLIGYDMPRPPSTPRGRRAPGRRQGSRSTFFAWIWPERRHVHLGFTHGTLLADPDRRLSGAGETKRARWLTYVPGDRIDARLAAALVRDAADIARRDPRDRAAELALAELQTG